MTSSAFPNHSWDIASPEDVGFDLDRLAGIRTWLVERTKDRKWRFVIVRGGKLAVEWNHGSEGSEKIRVASTWNSMLSNLLGIVVAEGKLPAADAEVYDYWPEYMDVPEGEGLQWLGTVIDIFSPSMIAGPEMTAEEGGP